MKPVFKRMTLEDWLWFTEQLPIFRVEDSMGFVVWDGDKRVAAWVYDNYTGTSIQSHLIVSNKMCLRHGVVETIAGIAFDVLGCYAIYALVPSNNEAAIKMNEHIGFEEKCRMANAYKMGVDSVLLELIKDNCKYYSAKEAA